MMSDNSEVVGWAKIVEMRPYPEDLKRSYSAGTLEETTVVFNGGDERKLEEKPERIEQFLRKAAYSHRTAIILINNLRPDNDSGLHFLPSDLINLYGFSYVAIHCTRDIAAYGVSLYSMHELKTLSGNLKKELSFWPTKSVDLLSYFK